MTNMIEPRLFIKHPDPLGQNSILRGRIQRLFGNIDFVDLSLDDLYRSYTYYRNPLILVDATLESTKNLSL